MNTGRRHLWGPALNHGRRDCQSLSSRWFIIRWPGRYVGASDAALLFVLDSSCACACFVARRRTGNMGSWRDC
uniref:Uncharacterized protein n=1 Tax=Ralstonia solanacearum CFBP2957 TaxID=859656 RepID=D8P2K7_RALSL|nr:protein of unknown function [Ralstonia solanacearum CFBP2957]